MLESLRLGPRRVLDAIRVALVRQQHLIYMRQLSLNRSSIAQTAVVSLATLTAVVLIGLLAAHWTWVWLAPQPEPRAPGATDSGASVAAAGALFGSRQSDSNALAPTGIAIRLLGIVAATGAQHGYAVVQLEAKDIVAVAEGADLAPGIRLAEIGIDRVILERDGRRETLTWPESKSTTASPMLRPNR